MRFVCSDRGQHRPVTLLVLPADTSRLLPSAEWWRSQARGMLKCKRCPRNPRPSAEMIDALVQLVASRPDGRLDLSFLDL